jgi:membrane-associated phospholipid phosphatase
MKQELIPDTRNRLAYLVGLLFHPAVIGIPTLYLILKDLPLGQVVQWTVLIVGILVLPGFVAVQLYRQRGRYTYQRETRGVLYLIGWSCALLCTLLLVLLQAPPVLIACTTTLVVWVPLQLLINQRFTKISTHAAVVAGCATALLVLGELPTLWSRGLALAIVVAVCWARVVTRNHTLLQVALGVLLGSAVVLLVFPQLL